MNKIIEKISELGSQKSKLALGLMSGTSLDGLDIALCKVSGTGYNTNLDLLEFTTRSYSEEEKNVLRAITSVAEVELENFCRVHSWLGIKYGEWVNQVLNEWNYSADEIDFIASHGQTVYHAPNQQMQGKQFHTTLQIGDGDHLARTANIVTLSDFRQKHTAAGGEGAPLVALTDELLFRGTDEDRILLNIGGIANFTWLAGSGDTEGNGKTVVSSDTGPGNTLIDEAIEHFYPRKRYDDQGAIAASGAVDRRLLNILQSHPFFDREVPKTTGPEMFSFSWVRDLMREHGIDITPEDLVATLTRLTVDTVSASLKPLVRDRKTTVYVSGGGVHNKTLMRGLEEKNPDLHIRHFDELGLPGDAKEAISFVVLANEALSGSSFILDNGRSSPVNLGKISLPV